MNEKPGEKQRSRRPWRWVVFALCLIAAAAISAYLLRKPEERPKITAAVDAMREVDVAQFSDDREFAGLLDAIDTQLKYLKRGANQPALRFGSVTIARDLYLDKLKDLSEFIRSSGKSADILRYIGERFRFFEVYGDKRWGEVFITGYFEPVIPGDSKPSSQFPRALYRTPDDILKIELSKFDPAYANDRPRRARVSGGAVLPYYTRAEIDSGGALAGRQLELCWVDPVDAYFLQVQGSGTISFPDGREMKLRYAEKNGQAFTPVGKYLKEKLLPASPSYESIVKFLKAAATDDRQRALDSDPSYVFFAPSDVNALTSTGVPATAGRTIATDRKFFPPGALALLQYNSPGTDSKPISRFVLDQDVGGAIKGPGRVDFFFGRGEDAGKAAGSMQQRGRLYYLAPK